LARKTIIAHRFSTDYIKQYYLFEKKMFPGTTKCYTTEKKIIH
jgi:hypothetical protein